MKKLSPLACALLLVSCNAAAPPPDFPSGKIIDLSHAYDEQTVYWPTAEKTFRLEKDFEGQTEGGYFYAANSFSTAEHGGTHLDAPLHFAAGRNAADQIPLSQLMGPAVLLDVSGKC
jgi:kynurenine formamidase